MGEGGEGAEEKTELVHNGQSHTGCSEPTTSPGPHWGPKQSVPPLLLFHFIDVDIGA